MPVDNSAIVAGFCPEQPDGDTFIYTELLNRARGKGANSHRLSKTFFHRTVDEFWSQWPTIKALSDAVKIRAYTRLAPRSFERVGREFTRVVVDSHLASNYAAMYKLYNHALGVVTPNKKMWLFDVDKIDDSSEALASWLVESGHLITRIPSRKGEHLITRPFDTRDYPPIAELNIEVHKDNPTNLYIPDGAA